MKKLITLFLIVSLAGCASTTKTNVSMSFPSATQDLLTSCPDLAVLDPNTQKLSQVLEVVSSNYSQYYDCKVKVDSWIEWYNTQKSISESVK